MRSCIAWARKRDRSDFGHQWFVQPRGFSSDRQVSYPTLTSFMGGGIPSQYPVVTLCDIGHQGLVHDEAVSLIQNRARVLHPRLGRFMQRDSYGYMDGRSLYAAHQVMHSGNDPSGNLVIFVHGIKNYNVTDIKSVYSELRNAWGGQQNQALVHFKYSYKGREPGKAFATEGTWSRENRHAGAKLAKLIEHLQSERSRIMKDKNLPATCNEPIYLMAYSNGGNVAYHALHTYGAKVDGVLMVGSSLGDGVNLRRTISNSGQFYNFWSEYDAATEWVDGIGSDGLHGDDTTGTNVHDIEVAHVHHSVSEGSGRNPKLHPDNTSPAPGANYGSRRAMHYPAATTWLTRYMAKTHYADPTSNQGDLVLSNHGVLPDGTNLAPDSQFWMHVNMRPVYLDPTPSIATPSVLQSTVTYGSGSAP